MKRSEKMIVLGAVLVTVCVATFALTRYEEKQEEIQNSDAVILEIPADTVKSISWEFAEDELSFRREEGGWVYAEDVAFPVSVDKIDEILSRFEAFGVSFVIENVEDYGQYGLDDPSGVIRLETADRSYDIRLGDFSQMDEQRYVDIGDGNVYLVSRDPMDLLEPELSGMIDNDDTPEFETVVDITFRGSEDYTIVWNEESADTYHPEDVYFAQIDGKTLPLDTERVSEYLDTISQLSLSGYVTYHASEEELQTYGLDDPELTVTVNYTYQDEEEQEIADSCVLHISRNPEEWQAAQEAEENGEESIPPVTEYVRIGDSGIVYELGDADYQILSAAGYDDLRHREVIWADFETVTGIDIALEGENHTITSEPNEEDEETARVWYYDGEELDFSDLQSALENLSADSFTDAAPTEKEEIGLTVHLDNENFPQVNIRLYRHDGSTCLAVVDGESVSLVDRGAVMELVEAVQAIVLN